MKRMLRLVWLLALLALLVLPASAADYDWRQFNMDCSAAENGVTTVTVSATAHITKAVEGFSMPLGKHVSKVNVTGASCKVRREKGVSILEFTTGSGFTGDLSLSWSYEIDNTVSTQDGEQLFSLPLLSEQDGDLTGAKYTIKLPGEFEQSPAFVSGYYSDGIDNYMDISVSDGVISATLKQPLLAGDTLVLSLPLPEGFFSLRNVAGRTVPADWIALLILTILCAVYWFFCLRGPLFFPRRQSRAPAGVSAGVIPYLLYGQTPDLALQTVFWAGRGYLFLHWERNGRIALHRQMTMGNERNADEERVFAALFSKHSVVLHTDAAYRRTAEYAIQPVSKFWWKRLFSRRSGNPKILLFLALAGMFASGLYTADLLLPSTQLRWLPMLLGCAISVALGYVLQRAILSLRGQPTLRQALPGIGAAVILLTAGALCGSAGMMVLSIALQVLCCLGVWFGGVRNPGGADLLSQLLGFRLYLRRLTPADAAGLLQQDPQYFYKTLPFAEALGVGARFTAAFSQLHLEHCNWFSSARGTVPRDAAAFRKLLLHTLQIMRGMPVSSGKKKPPQNRQKQNKQKPHQAQAPARRRPPSGDYNHEIGRNNNPSGRRRHRIQEYDPLD